MFENNWSLAFLSCSLGFIGIQVLFFGYFYIFYQKQLDLKKKLKETMNKVDNLSMKVASI